MARGRLLRTKVKEVRALKKAELEAQFAFDKKKVKAYLNMDLPTLLKSASGHLGKIIDRATVDDIVCIGTGFMGYQVFGNIQGGLVGMIGYKLATSESEVASAAGLAILGAIGIIGVFNIAGIPAAIVEELRNELLRGLPDFHVSDANEAKRLAHEYVGAIMFRYQTWRIAFLRPNASIWDFVDWGGIRAEYSDALAVAEASGGGAR